MRTCVQYPPRKMQSLGCDRPITLSKHRFREQLAKEGFKIQLPTGN